MKGRTMADFLPAFEKMIINEGGYILHNVAGDRGGQTYAGIARNFHSNWEGWAIIDQGKMDNPELTQMVRNFYKDNYWDKVGGDDLNHQGLAAALFDFAVNAGIKTASKLAQLVIGATPDGVIGPKSVSMLNTVDEEHFITKSHAMLKFVNAVPAKRNFCWVGLTELWEVYHEPAWNW
jgi:lysozyme family protein